VTTAIEHAVEDETAPLAVQPAEVGTNRCAGVPATARSGVRKIRCQIGACTSSQKMSILSHRKAKAEPNGIFRQKPLEDCVTQQRAFVRWLLPPWSTFVLFEREGGGGGHVSMAKWARFCIPNRQVARRCQVARSKAGSCEVHGPCVIPRSLPRWRDPDPLGGLSPAYIPENRKGRRRGARDMYRVLSDEAGEFRGCHCLGRSLPPGQRSPVGPTPVPPLRRHLATEVHKTSRPWTAAG
jgi:hypothetical protein